MEDEVNHRSGNRHESMLYGVIHNSTVKTDRHEAEFYDKPRSKVTIIHYQQSEEKYNLICYLR